MEGPRDKITNLWTIPIRQSSPSEPQAPTDGVSVITTPSKYNNKSSIRIVPHSANTYTQRSAAELQAWHHGTLGSPPPATLIDTIKNDRLSTFPGLSVEGVRRHLPKALATPMGHMHKYRQNMRSTKTPTIDELMNEEFEPDIVLEPPRQILDQKDYVGVKVIKFEDLKGTIATDQTRRFPITSRQGNKYIMVLYDFNSNVIDTTAIKSRKTEDLIEGYEKLYQHLQQGGIQPVLHKLDNEVSQQMIDAIKEKNLKYQLVPPGDHQTNPAERAIQTVKNH